MTGLIHAFLWFIFYSFVGWAYETLLALAVHKKFMWKNFLQGPFCPVYGLGALAVIWLLTPLQGQLLPLFLLGALVTCSVEYVTAWFLETFFQHKEWDYTPRKWNLQGRVCALGALVFGIFSVLLIEYIHPAVAAFTDRIPYIAQLYFFTSFGVLIAVDFFITFRKLAWKARVTRIPWKK